MTASELRARLRAGATKVAERAIGVDGPIREYYVVSFVDTDDEEQYRTEVCWPVFLTAAT